MSLSIYALTPPRRDGRRPPSPSPEAPRPARSALSAVLSPDSALKSTPFPLSEPKVEKHNAARRQGYRCRVRAIPWTWVATLRTQPTPTHWYGSPASSR